MARRRRGRGHAHADSTGLEALEALTKDLRRDEITLAVARLRTRMEQQFELAGLTETIGSQHFYPTVHAAVEAFVRSEGGSGVSTGVRPDAS